VPIIVVSKMAGLKCQVEHAILAWIFFNIELQKQESLCVRRKTPSKYLFLTFSSFQQLKTKSCNYTFIPLFTY
jgi:hypothetical protein